MRMPDVTVRSARRDGIRLLLAGSLWLWGASPVAAQNTSADLTTTTCAAGNSISGCAVFAVTGMGTAAIQLTQTWSGTITFSGSIKGGAFNNIACTSTAAASSASETTTANGLFVCPVAGLAQLRVAFTAFASGTARVDFLAAPGGGGSSSGSGGGGTQYTEGTADTTITGTAVLFEGAADVLKVVNATDRLPVTCDNCGGGTGGTAAGDNSVFTVGTSSATPFSALFDNTTPTSATEDRVATLRMSANRNLFVNIRDAAGNERGLNIDASGNLAANATLTAETTKVIGTVNLSAAQTLATVTTVGAVTAISNALPAGTNNIGDVDINTVPAPLSTSGNGTAATALRVTIASDSSTLTVGSHAVTNVGTFAVQADTELSTAAAASDAFANPTVGGVLGFNMCWNGTTWDRCRSSLSTEQTHDTPVTATSVIGGSPLLLAKDFDGVALPNVVSLEGDAVLPSASLYGVPYVMVVNEDGSLERGTATTPLVVTTDSATGCYIVSAASTNSTSCKGSAGNFYGLRIFNTTATIYYLRLYNSAAAPTCSSATGFIESIPIPATATGVFLVAVTTMPLAYPTGIGFCLTAGSSSTDNVAAAVGIFGAIYYK